MASAISSVGHSRFQSITVSSSSSNPFLASVRRNSTWVSASIPFGCSAPRVQSNVTLKPKASFLSGTNPLQRNRRSPNLILCRAAHEYKFPDPIPEFAVAETAKFRTHLHEKLSKKDMFGDEVENIVAICAEIFDTFLHTEYGGPGTLLVDPFADMADTISEEGLPGAPQAARAAIIWAQNHVDKDWEAWTRK